MDRVNAVYGTMVIVIALIMEFVFTFKAHQAIQKMRIRNDGLYIEAKITDLSNCMSRRSSTRNFIETARVRVNNEMKNIFISRTECRSLKVGDSLMVYYLSGYDLVVRGSSFEPDSEIFALIVFLAWSILFVWLIMKAYRKGLSGLI